MASTADRLLGPQRPAVHRLPPEMPSDYAHHTERREVRMQGRLNALRWSENGLQALGSQAVEYGDPPREGYVWRVRAAGADDPRGWSVGRIERIRHTREGTVIETSRGQYLLEAKP